MTVTLNRGFLLWAIGVLQPVSADELLFYMKHVFSDGGSLPSREFLHSYLIESANMGQTVRILRDPDLFSLTMQGNAYLSRVQRMSRDRERIFLLIDTWNARNTTSREDQAAELGGASPSLNQRAILEGTRANEFGPSVPQGQTHWPRYSKQLAISTGSSSSSRDTFIDLLSFTELSQVHIARRGHGQSAYPDLINLGLMIGLTPRLISQIVARPDRHYRAFQLKKKGGGSRDISSPRVFLKTIQRFISDYIFAGLPLHNAVHSFRHDRSILSNAERHVGNRWVANIDVENFFGSISEDHLRNYFVKMGFDAPSSRILSKLATLGGVLPQGAPTSPVLSNVLLYDFDDIIDRKSKELKINYTRYADDITFSGNNISDIKLMLGFAPTLLTELYGLTINHRKTRILSRRSRQVVTGVVVNDVALPPRSLRRKIRSATYNASRSKEVTAETYNTLSGYIGYFRSFPKLISNKEFADLESNMIMAKSKM